MKPRDDYDQGCLDGLEAALRLIRAGYTIDELAAFIRNGPDVTDPAIRQALLNERHKLILMN